MRRVLRRMMLLSKALAIEYVTIICAAVVEVYLFATFGSPPFGNPG